MAFVLGAVCGAVLLIFLFQNLESTSVTFLAWTLTINRGLFILILFALGFVIGWVVRSLGRGRQSVSSDE